MPGYNIKLTKYLKHYTFGRKKKKHYPNSSRANKQTRKAENSWLDSQCFDWPFINLIHHSFNLNLNQKPFLLTPKLLWAVCSHMVGASLHSASLTLFNPTIFIYIYTHIYMYNYLLTSTAAFINGHSGHDISFM